MSMISKDIASIIAKYNTPTPVYSLTNWFGFQKFLAFDDIDEYTKYLFDNRFNEQLSWLRDWNGGLCGYNFIPQRDYRDNIREEPTYNNYEQFKQIFIRHIQRLDIDYYKK